MEIIIYRRRFTRWGVDGTIVIGTKVFCETLEHPRALFASRTLYRLALFLPSKEGVGDKEEK